MDTALEAIAPAEEVRRNLADALGMRIQQKADEAVSLRSELETRWLADIRQYNGRYEPQFEAALKNEQRSTVFFNISRVKSSAVEARLAEMILPTDDRNFAIQPTPEPELADQAYDNSPITVGANVVTLQGQPVTVSMAVQDLLREAEKRAESMQRKIDDCLAECRYNAVARDVIHDMVVLGTGVTKGPVTRAKHRKRFAKGPAGYAMQFERTFKPVAERVDPWDFFPPMTDRTWSEVEEVLQRHRLTRSQMRKHFMQPGFEQDALNRVLSTSPSAAGGLVDQVPDNGSARQSMAANRYQVWEYHGIVDAMDLAACGAPIDPDDHLTEYRAVVFVCNGIVLKAVLYPPEIDELIYDVCVYERDDNSVFGYGVPYLMRNSQNSVNAFWRGIHDYMAHTVLPQYVLTHALEPAGANKQDYRATPGKTWRTTEQGVKASDALGVVRAGADIDKLLAMFQVARQLPDDETGMPMIAQGQQSPTVTKTAQGMSILMNSANTVLRRLVKQFDDDVTVPLITRFYHWLMRYETDESIKGDYEVVALGSSALLVREQQLEQMLKFAQLASSNPEFIRRVKWGDFFRAISQAMSINAERFIKSDEEAAAQNAPNPEQEAAMAKAAVDKLLADVAKQKAETERMEAEFKAEMARNEQEFRQASERMKLAIEAGNLELAWQEARSIQELTLARIASEERTKAAQVRRDYDITAIKTDSDHQLFNAEAALRVATGAGI